MSSTELNTNSGKVSDRGGFGNGRRFYLTTAISYPNGSPHIGHAYEAIATDALARFKRIDGWNVHFVTGTDEHGQKMAKAAQINGITPLELANKNSALFMEMAQRLNISYDDFIRTTEPRHETGAQYLWRAMHENGDMYQGKYSGWYSLRDEAYIAEDELIVDAEGRKTSPSGTPVEWVEEPTWFFKLSTYAERLLEFYRQNPNFVGPKERFNEVIRFVEGGLNDLSISRTSFNWGVRVPDEEKHVMYVWVDALTSYASAVGLGRNDNIVQDGLWPADLHVIGKDIVRFHAVYWPAFLMSANLPLPRRIFAHGFLFNRGEKMSKSVGNVVDPIQLADHFGTDGMRYFFMREVPFGRDGSYNATAMATRINADLANDFGNLAQRTLSMIQRYFGGNIPVPGNILDEDKAELDGIASMVGEVRQAMSVEAPHAAIAAIWDRINSANRYIATTAPWKLQKEDPERSATVLYVAADLLRCFAIVTQPFVPSGAARLLDLLAIPEDSRTIASIDEGTGSAAPALQPGTELPKPEVLFSRIAIDPS